MTIPRRVFIDKHSSTEAVIRAAMIVIENAGADPLLTEAQSLLSRAGGR